MLPQPHRRVGPLLMIGAVLLSPAALAQETSPPLPPPRPDTLHAPAEAAADKAEAPPRETPLADTACLDGLARLGVRFEPRPRIVEGACTVETPVLVSELPDGLAVSPPSLMTCGVAVGLARWSLDTVSAEADRHFQTAPTKIAIATSYECRNQRSGAKLSEHAFGNGVDVMGFEFHKHAPLTIGFHAEETPEGAFQAAIRKGACATFTTVLGPGSDAAHGDHLHLDMRARRGGYRICQ